MSTRVLVVDDEPQLADLVARHLIREGYAAETATDGIEALSLASRRPFDLAVVDVNMPGMTGFELTRRLKQTASPIAVLLLTGGDVSFASYFPFILMLGVMMVAAPGVPGGAIAAAAGLLVQMLGFGEVEVGLMFAAYIALDSFGTATNVTGDGALAMIVNKLSRGRLGAQAQDAEDEVVEPLDRPREA